MDMKYQMTIFAFLFGAAMGSFANVLIYRLPEGQSIVHPGSRCPACGTAIRWFDNIPILSYLILRARCRSCGEPISIRYPFVEALSGALFSVLVLRFGVGLYTLITAFFVWSLVVVTFIDIDHWIIPNVISIPGTVAGIAVSFLPGSTRPVDALMGVVFGAGILFLVLYGYEKVMGTEGMGMGDVKLLAMIGAFLGWQALPVTILVSSLAGSLVGIGYALVRGESLRKLPIPFGPFLALGAAVHIFFGLEIIQWYLGKL